MAQPLLNATELDFDQIKANLREYFQRQDSPIKDWNFNGSGLNMLLDVLAYNTHYNAVLAHLNLNESFIDTAQLRSSVISQAKLLGYIPKSISAAKVTVTASFSSSGSPITGSTLSIPAGTKFTGSSPNGSYTFMTEGGGVANYLSSQSAYVITLPLIQGVYRSQTYQVDNTIANQKFVIDDPSADISTLTVNVFESQNSTSPTPYVPISNFIANNGGDISNVIRASQIYYLSLNSTGTYEVNFGDGVIGQALNNLNVVQLTYVSTQGPSANGISNFTYADSTLESNDNPAIPISTVTVSASSAAADGADQESIDSIRLNAPASLIAQNRAVTANDYIALIKNKFDSITSINVWGGEDEVSYDPTNASKYAGKVFISYTPESAVDSSNVINYVTPYKVMSVTPYFYAPDYVNLYLNTNFKYNPNLTTIDSVTLVTDVNSIINSYNDENLEKFTGVFRHSNLLRQIDTSDPSILNSDIQVSFYKKYTVNSLISSSDVVTLGIGSFPNPNGLVTTFGNKLYGSIDQINSMISSDSFTLGTITSPAQTAVTVTGSYNSASSSLTVLSSPGITGTNTLTNPFLVVGATVTSSSAGIPGGTKIQSISNTGTQSILTLTANATATVSSATIYVTPPAGTFYLKDADDPTSTTSRRLFMSTNSGSVVFDPKYTSTGSDIHIGTVYPLTGKIELYRYFSGTTTSQPVAQKSLQDSSYGTAGGAWLNNQFAGCVLYITAGTGVGSTVTISTNSGDTLYWASPPITLDSTSQYILIRSCIDATATQNINIYSRPASNDVAPSRHQLLTIDASRSTVTATADSFAQSGVLGANTYTTFSRDP